MSDYDMLTEEERAEHERDYNEWLERLEQERVEEDLIELPEIDDQNSEEDDLLESYDETYVEEDEQVYGYDDLIDREEEYRELDFND
jgi:hypothetical protein